MKQKNWREELEVGDKVIVGRYDRDCISQVTGLTKTQIKVGNVKFRKSDGREVGEILRLPPSLQKWTQQREDDILAKRRRSNNVDYLKTRNWEFFSNSQLSEISDLVRKLVNERKGENL